MQSRIERVRERYNEYMAKYVENVLKLLSDAEAGEIIGDPVEKIKEELDEWLEDRYVETTAGLVRFLQTMVAPIGKVSAKQINAQKYIIIEKVEQPHEPTQNRPTDIKHIKTKCIVCNNEFDFFGAHEGDCQTRYRGRTGLVVDSLVVCPKCEQKDRIVWADGKEYYKRGKIPRKRKKHLFNSFDIKAMI